MSFPISFTKDHILGIFEMIQFGRSHIAAWRRECELRLRDAFLSIRPRAWPNMLLCGVVVLVGTLSAGCATGSVTYSSDELVGHVVAPDGKPLPGVIIVANWELKDGFQGNPIGQLAVYEVVTNEGGEFRIPQWGPRTMKTGEWGGYVQSRIRFFHAGYIPILEYQFDKDTKPQYLGEMNRETLRKKAVVLNPFHGSMLEYERALYALSESFSFAKYGEDPCAWKKIPQITIALYRVKLSLKREGLGRNFFSLYEQAAVSQSLCGDPNKFFEDYLKND